MSLIKPYGFLESSCAITQIKPLWKEEQCCYYWNETNHDNIVKIPTMQQPSGLEISLTSLFRPAAEDCFTSNKEWDAWGSQNEKKEKEREAGELSLPFDSSIWSLGMNLQIIVTPLAPGIEQKKRAAAVIIARLKLKMELFFFWFFFWKKNNRTGAEWEKPYTSNTYQTHGPWINSSTPFRNTI